MNNLKIIFVTAAVGIKYNRRLRHTITSFRSLNYTSNDKVVIYTDDVESYKDIDIGIPVDVIDFKSMLSPLNINTSNFRDNTIAKHLAWLDVCKYNHTHNLIYWFDCDAIITVNRGEFDNCPTINSGFFFKETHTAKNEQQFEHHYGARINRYKSDGYDLRYGRDVDNNYIFPIETVFMLYRGNTPEYDSCELKLIHSLNDIIHFSLAKHLNHNYEEVVELSHAIGSSFKVAYNMPGNLICFTDAHISPQWSDNPEDQQKLILCDLDKVVDIFYKYLREKT
jgi:hypothetical protein